MLERLGEFQIKKQLGEGGMGAVYLAYQDSLERDVALKVLTERLCQNDEFIQRFKREARSAASIIHPNVIQIRYGSGQGQGLGRDNGRREKILH
jgi:serine/threonine-protein kinase